MVTANVRVVDPATLESMDKAAEAAGEELKKIALAHPEASKIFGAWVRRNKGGAGLKRLARIIEGL